MPDPAHSSPAYGRPTPKADLHVLLYWSLWKERWIAGGPLGPAKLSIDRALEFIAAEDIFWTHR